MRFAFIHIHREQFELGILLRVMRVSKSGYHAWVNRDLSARASEDALLMQRIKCVHQGSRSTYGAPRIMLELRKQGTRISKHRVARLMREAGLTGLSRPKRRVKTTDSVHDQPIAQNKLKQDFTAQKPDQKWVSDLTYLPTTEGWLYLAVVLDLFSSGPSPEGAAVGPRRRVVGWAFSSSLESRVVLEALRMAQVQRSPEQGLVFHSDRGVQYASFDFRQALARLEAVQSMSRKGNCWDNAPCESFFSTLKLELGLDVPVGSRDATERLVFEWIEVFYNRQRLHSRLGGHSPVSFEESRVAA